jgi:hypothetical protein
MTSITAATARKKPGRRRHGPLGTDHDPPPEVVAERDRAYGRGARPYSDLMGDPPPGRSALERRTSGLPTSVARVCKSQHCHNPALKLHT